MQKMLIWTLTNALFVCPDPNYFIVIVAELCFQNYNLNFTTGSHARRFMKRIFLSSGIFLHSRIVNREKKMFLPLFFQDDLYSFLTLLLYLFAKSRRYYCTYKTVRIFFQIWFTKIEIQKSTYFSNNLQTNIV